ncbi:MAG TPA: hypothetical protein VFN88_00675 [Caulobacteraceae bacterium]|nr:hypothetical protein [Caulobacteraceae bacterium]
MRNILKDRLRAYGNAREIARIRREAATMSPTDQDRLLERVEHKSMVFAVASGRSGTQSLAKIFEAVSNVHATHEGVPAFQDVMREALQDPSLARDFLLTRKLPAIAAIAEPIYLESSHVFAKGFLPPLLGLGLRPKLVFLKRDPRKIALSLERIGATPLRTRGGREHFLSPADPSMLPATPWDDFSNYQICYWYALETMRRQQILREMAMRAGCACRTMRIEELQTPNDVWSLMTSLGLPVEHSPTADAALAERVGQSFNQKPKSPHLVRPTADIEAQERIVVERIQTCIPELNLRRMIDQYLLDDADDGEGIAPARRSASGRA